MWGNLAQMLKQKGLIQPPSDAPRVGETRYQYDGTAYKILEVDWMNDCLLVQHENDPPQICGYYTFCACPTAEKANPHAY